jgi:hypothetical protein
MPDWWRWFSYIDFAAHAVRAITLDQFHCGNADRTTCPVMTLPGSAATITLEAWAEKQVGIVHADMWRETGIAAAIVAAVAVAAVALHRLNWQKR